MKSDGCSQGSSPRLESSRKLITKYTEFRIFEETLGIVASQHYINCLDTKLRQSHDMFAKSMKVTGSGLSCAYTGSINKFRMNLPNTGYGYVDLRFSGPCRVIVNHQQTKSGFLEIFYKANVPGDYSLDVSYLGHEVPGSDFKIKVKQQECNPKAVSVSGRGLKKVAAGERARFNVDTRKAGSGKLDITIQSLSIDDNEIRAYVDATKTGYKVEYYPKCTGSHSVAVRYNGVHVLGSPFQAKILAIQGGNESEQNRRQLLRTKRQDNEQDCEMYGDYKKSRQGIFGWKLMRLQDLKKLTLG